MLLGKQKYSLSECVCWSLGVSWNRIGVVREWETHRWLWSILYLKGYGSRKNSGEEVRTVNSFCLQLDNVVMARESSGGPASHLSYKLNSKLTPFGLLEPEATKDCQASGPLGCMDISQEAKHPLFPLGFPTFVSHNSPSRNLPCMALIPFPCDFFWDVLSVTRCSKLTTPL